MFDAHELSDGIQSIFVITRSVIYEERSHSWPCLELFAGVKSISIIVLRFLSFSLS